MRNKAVRTLEVGLRGWITQEGLYQEPQGLQEPWLQHLTQSLSHQTEARRLLSRTQVPPGGVCSAILGLWACPGMRRCLLRFCIPGWDGDREGEKAPAAGCVFLLPCAFRRHLFLRAVPLGYAELQEERERLLCLFSSFHKSGRPGRSGGESTQPALGTLCTPENGGSHSNRNSQSGRKGLKGFCNLKSFICA